MVGDQRRLLVYGAYGYTARLVLERLAALDFDLIVAGRNGNRIEELAAQLKVPGRVFSLDCPGDIDRGLDGVTVVLNAAGPYLHTASPMIAACLRGGVHYLDLSGEVGPLSQAVAASGVARALGLMILPAIGFDVVASDCLAVHVSRRLPDAKRLTLYIAASNLLSHGSGLTLADHIGIPVQVRRNGRLEAMRMRMQMRWIDFGSGHRPAVAVSWGDIVTAYHSTGIRDIEVYFEATAFRHSAVVLNQYWGWLLRSMAANEWFRAYASLLPDGPAEAERARERSTLVAEAASDSHVVRTRLETPEAYEFTGASVTRIVERVMGGHRVPGFQTPGTLFGPDFVTEFDGVTRVDI